MLMKLKFISILMAAAIMLLPAFTINVMGSGTINVTLTVPTGSVISTPAPPGTIRVDLGVNGGMLFLDGTPVINAPAGSSVVFHSISVMTAIISGGNGNTSVTMPILNSIGVADNGSTITVTLPGEAPVTIPANGSNWYAVLFNSNGGNHVPARIIESGAAIARPINLTRPGFIFSSWYSNAALTTVWNFNTNTVTGITTLYARWDSADGGAPPEGGDVPPVTPPLEVPDDEVLEDEVSEDELLEEEAPEDELSDEESQEIEQEPDEQDEAYDETAANGTSAEEQYSEAGTPGDTADSQSNGSNRYMVELTYREYIDNEHTLQGEQVIVEFSLTNFGNPISQGISNYRVISRPSSGLQFLSGDLPAFTYGHELFYTIRYRTNLNGSHQIIADKVPANMPFVFSSPELQYDEIITEISIEFDAIPIGFGIGDTITHSFAVLDENHMTHDWEIKFGETSNQTFIISTILNDIDRISGFQNSYDTASWENLQVVVHAVHETLNNPEATLEELELAYALLQQAISELNPISSNHRTGSITTFSIFALFISLIFVFLKLQRYKKRTTLNLKT